jgi:hypothetical protein
MSMFKTTGKPSGGVFIGADAKSLQLTGRELYIAFGTCRDRYNDTIERRLSTSLKVNDVTFVLTAKVDTNIISLKVIRQITWDSNVTEIWVQTYQ